MGTLNFMKAEKGVTFLCGPERRYECLWRITCVTTAFHSCCKSCPKRVTVACTKTFSYLFIWSFKLKITHSCRTNPNFLEWSIEKFKFRPSFCASWEMKIAAYFCRMGDQLLKAHFIRKYLWMPFHPCKEEFVPWGSFKWYWKLL